MQVTNWCAQVAQLNPFTESLTALPLALVSTWFRIFTSFARNAGSLGLFPTGDWTLKTNEMMKAEGRSRHSKQQKSGTANTVGSWLSGWEAHQTPKVAWKIWTNEQDVFLRMHVTHEPMQSIKPEQIQRVDPRGNFVRIGLNLSSSALLNLKPHLKACLHSQIIYWFDVVIGTIETQKEIQRRLQAVLPDQDAILGQRQTDKQLKSLLAFAIQLSWGGLFNWGLCDWNGPPWAQVFLFFCRARSCTYWSDIIHPRAEGTKDLAQDLKIWNLRNWKRSRQL